MLNDGISVLLTISFASTLDEIFFREIKLVRKDENNVTIYDMMKTYGNERNHKELIERALKIDVLPIGWKSYYNEILQS